MGVRPGAEVPLGKAVVRWSPEEAPWATEAVPLEKVVVPWAMVAAEA
jgi:hypothetical protein